MPKKGYVEIDIEECKGCSLCVLNCPTECLALNTSDMNSYSLHYAYLSDEDKCIACLNCAVICPDAAITVYREVKHPPKEAVGGDDGGSAEGSSEGTAEGGLESAIEDAAKGASEGGKVG
jgi:2-oxoglutarate ferredoxin oxidoreductase subunit delta